MEKAFISWSGGKETSLACYRAMQDKSLKVEYLVNMVSEDGKRSRSHGLDSALLRAQADAMGIPIIQRKTTWKNYEGVFKKAVSELKQEGIKIGIFGDIGPVRGKTPRASASPLARISNGVDLQEHRDWVERICKKIEIKPLLLLWGEDREGLLKEFIRTGFKAIVVATKADLLGREWLGCRIDEEFIKDLKKLNGVDLCGEKGEYHTFVYDGPLFKKRIEITESKKVLRKDNWFLEILEWKFV